MSDKREAELLRLKTKAVRYTKRANDLEEKINESTWIPLLEKSVGKCFVYSNSYGSGERWPMYAKIVSCKGMTFTTVQFQHTSRKRVEIEYEMVYNFQGNNRFNEYHGWKEISAKEYEREKRKALRLVGELLGG